MWICPMSTNGAETRKFYFVFPLFVFTVNHYPCRLYEYTQRNFLGFY